jgi:hypothetical protein
MKHRRNDVSEHREGYPEYNVIVDRFLGIDKRVSAVSSEVAELRGAMMERIAVVDTRLNAALDGVANFKSFQEEDFPALRDSVNEFHTETRTRDKLKAEAEEKEAAALALQLDNHNKKMDRRLKIVLSSLGLFCTLLIGGGTIGTMIYVSHHDAVVQQSVEHTVHDSVEKGLRENK